jgi:serine/threonine-protein kinase HipA
VVGRRVDVARVRLWGHDIGAVYWDDDVNLGAFEYEPKFQRSGIELAPLMMPLGSRIFRFPAHTSTSFHGLPGLLADSLPDNFGNAVIDQWLVREGRDRQSFSPVERLCYIGQRGTGALEYRPATRSAPRGSVPIEIASLVELAGRVLRQRNGIHVAPDTEHAMDDILRVGASAGGARAKAVLAWNPQTNEIRSGQVTAPAGFEYWLLKFDGVDNQQYGVHDPQGYGLIEYAYYEMALAAGIEMAECRLLHEGGRSHFMTRRFDRDPTGQKRHLQSLAAIAHLDHQMAGAHSYEQAMQVITDLAMPVVALEQQFRRMVFNVVARNQDDHTKNIAFLMGKNGVWSLAPAFDMNYAYNPAGAWTSRHQMTINGKRDDFSQEDFEVVADRFQIHAARDCIAEVSNAVSRWPCFARDSGVSEDSIQRIARTHRLDTALVGIR